MNGNGKRREQGGGGAYPLPPRLAAILECLPLDRLTFTPVRSSRGATAGPWPGRPGSSIAWRFAATSALRRAASA